MLMHAATTGYIVRRNPKTCSAALSRGLAYLIVGVCFQTLGLWVLGCIEYMAGGRGAGDVVHGEARKREGGGWVRVKGRDRDRP